MKDHFVFVTMDHAQHVVPYSAIQIAEISPEQNSVKLTLSCGKQEIFYEGGVGSTRILKEGSIKSFRSWMNGGVE